MSTLSTSLIENGHVSSLDISCKGKSFDIGSDADGSKKAEAPMQYRVLGIVALALFCDYLLLTLCIPILPNLLSPTFSPFLISLVFAAKPAVQIL